MNREQLSKIISNIDERLVTEAYHFDPDCCSDSSERIVHMKKKKIISLALAAALVLSMGIVAYAAENWWLQDLVLKSSKTDATETTNNQSNDPLSEGTFISLQGYAESPEYQAALAWSAFEANYDIDGQILAQVDNGTTPWDDTYNANGYRIYSQEMADSLDAIASEYGLTLHSGGIHSTNSMDELYERFGNFCKVENYYGYYFDDGTFQCDCTYNGISFQLRRCMKGTMDVVYLNIGDADQYKQWVYQTSTGVTVLLATGQNGALIIADLQDCFVAVNVPYCKLSEQDLEALADIIDFSIL